MDILGNLDVSDKKNLENNRNQGYHLPAMLRLILPILLLFSSFHLGAESEILVSIAPQKYLVERIGGSEVTVQVLVPLGASSHTYEPTPKQMIAAAKGKIWFRIGEPFEERLLPVCSRVQIVDQREGLDLIRGGCKCHGIGYDPHIWLSPRLLKTQADQIAQTLIAYDPLNRSLYQKNLIELQADLDSLDTYLSHLFQEHLPTVVVSHPAYGYLCRDYGIQQIAIEMEGKEPTPRYLASLMTQVRALNTERIFVQKQHSSQGGTRIAREIGAECIFLDPYKEDVIANLKSIAEAFAFR